MKAIGITLLVLAGLMVLVTIVGTLKAAIDAPVQVGIGNLMRYAHDMEVISNLFIFLAIIGGIIAALSFPLFLLPAAGLILQAIVLRAVAKVIKILAEKE